MPNLANILGLLGINPANFQQQQQPPMGLLGGLSDGMPTAITPEGMPMPLGQQQPGPFGLLNQPQSQPQSPALPTFAQPDIPAPGAVPAGPAQMPPMPPERPAGVNLSGPLQLPGARPPVPVGGVDMPMSPMNPMNPDMPAIGARQAGPMAAAPGAPATPQAAPAQGGGFFDKLGTLAGSIYGGGKNPGDNLIALGAGLASGPNWGQGLMKGMSMVNANALTAKKTEEEQKRTAGMLTMAEAMSKRNGQPVAVNLGILQSGMGAPILQDTLKRDTPQLVTVKDPITGVDRQEWVQPGQTSGTAIGGGAPQVGGAAAPAIPGQPQGTDASGQPRGLYSDPSGNRMYRTIDGRDIPVVGNIPDAVKTLTEADQKAVAEAPVAYRNLASLRDNVDELKKHSGLKGWFGLTSMGGAVGEYTSPEVRDAKSRLEQVKGQAFLQAFQQLKGAGAVTEAEGAKASQAIARLNDPRIGAEAFNKALDDLKTATEEAMQRLSKVPGVNVGQPSKANGGVSWRVVQ